MNDKHTRKEKKMTKYILYISQIRKANVICSFYHTIKSFSLLRITETNNNNNKKREKKKQNMACVQ